MKNKKQIYTTLALSVFVISIVTAAWQAQRVRAIQDSELQFGLISITPGQTLRLNAVYLGGPDTSPARVRLVFDVYERGAPTDNPNASSLVFIRRESCMATLMPREGASCEFDPNDVNSFVNAVMFGDELDGPSPHIAPTLELREGGRTVFMHPGVAKGFNPQPDPPGNN